MIGRIKEHADRVVIIGNIPQRAKDPLDCLSAHLDDVRWCNTPRSEAVHMGLQHQILAERTVAQQYGAQYIDTVPWFCTGSYCPATVAGLIVLGDVGHATVQYSRWLRDALGTAAGLL
jgi:hypothetical protein